MLYVVFDAVSREHEPSQKTQYWYDQSMLGAKNIAYERGGSSTVCLHSPGWNVPSSLGLKEYINCSSVKHAVYIILGGINEKFCSYIEHRPSQDHCEIM